MTSYFVNNDWTRHTDNILEAKWFIDLHQRNELISYFDNQDTSCPIHSHTHHTPNNEQFGDALFWGSECFKKVSPPAHGYQDFNGIASVVHKLNDAANRHTNKPMKLAKVVFHKYKTGSSGPVHSDIYPLATLLYLNDDYDGGSLYFPDQKFSITPMAGSLLTFRGGSDHKHGVHKIIEGNRYVLVAFWDFEEADELSNFWYYENKIADDINNAINKKSNYLKTAHKNSNILFPDIFPILEIKEYITPQKSDLLFEFMKINHIEGDECFGPPCFPEYYKLAYGQDAEPKLIEGIDLDTLDILNQDIKKYVVHALEWKDEELKFSKLKGHRHTIQSYSPPHGHTPAAAVAILCLGNEFSGGEITIPALNISFKPEPYSLYVFPEGDSVKHGVSVVTDGLRITLVSHWQPADNPYDKAGANN